MEEIFILGTLNMGSTLVYSEGRICNFLISKQVMYIVTILL
jgi:hypothetical protein